MIVIDRVLYRLSHGVEKRPSLRIVVCWQHAFGCTDRENGLFGVVTPSHHCAWLRLAWLVDSTRKGKGLAAAILWAEFGFLVEAHASVNLPSHVGSQGSA